MQQPSFPEEASRLNDRGNLPLHAACSFQATADVVEVLLKSYPGGASQPNGVGNLPIHQAAMWQAPVETVEVLLARHPEGATVRNQYGSLPLHMAASNRATPEVVKLLIDAYPDALHLQNDDGMTPLDLAMADETMVNDQVVAMLEGRPPPPELTRRQKAEKYEERAMMLERKMSGMRGGGRGGNANGLKLALAAVRKLADRFPHALYTAGMDPNELEIAFSDQLEGGNKIDAEQILMDAVRKRSKNANRDVRGMAIGPAPRDRVEELLSSIIGLDHIKSQVCFIYYPYHVMGCACALMNHFHSLLFLGIASWIASYCRNLRFEGVLDPSWWRSWKNSPLEYDPTRIGRRYGSSSSSSHGLPWEPWIW